MRQISLADRYSLNICENKTLQYSHSKHLNRVAAIYKQKRTAYEEVEKEQSKMLDYMHHNKQAARVFNQTETKRNLERSDKILQKRMLYHSCTKTIPLAMDSTQAQIKQQRKYPKKIMEQQQIERQNKKIQLALLQQNRNKKKYRKEIQKNIENYLNLRERIKRIKLISNEKRAVTSMQESNTPQKSQIKKNIRSRTKAYTSMSKSNQKHP